MNEFFQVRTVREALEGFRPAHRVESESVPVEAAGGRILAVEAVASSPLPGFSRSAVDGFAVQAMDTFGASEGSPSYLDVTGEVLMGHAAGIRLEAGEAIEIPTGGAIPDGADAIVMVEYTTRVEATRIEVTRPVASNEGVTGFDDDVAAGDILLPRGQELRPQDVGMLAAAGIAEVEVWRRPIVAIVSTGDEIVPPTATALRPGQVRDANTAALSALVIELGGEPRSHGIVSDDPGALEVACRDALTHADLLLVSAGSSVGTRDATAEVIGRLGSPGAWCHGIAIKPGKPTLLGEALDRPIIGLPGNPLSALVVMRLIGGAVIALIGGRSAPISLHSVTATLARNVASSTGRYDIAHVTLERPRESHGEIIAHPVFGRSSQLSVLTAADGFITIPDDVQGLSQGASVLVECYR